MRVADVRVETLLRQLLVTVGTGVFVLVLVPFRVVQFKISKTGSWWTSVPFPRLFLPILRHVVLPLHRRQKSIFGENDVSFLAAR